MNKTRIKWSKKLHCCEDRKSSLVYFFSLASTFGGIVVVFYLTVFIWGKTHERDGYEAIDDESAPAMPTPPPAQSQIESIPSTSNHTENQQSGSLPSYQDQNAAQTTSTRKLFL